MELFYLEPRDENALLLRVGHNPSWYGECCFGLDKWLDASLGEKAIPSRAQGQLMPVFKEQGTWDTGVEVRICSPPASRKGKRK